jgi:putative transposase
LQVAPSTYYDHKSRPPSLRALRDTELSGKLVETHKRNRSVYGVRKLWQALVREDIDVGRDHVGRLMKDLGLTGVIGGTKKRTTIPDPQAERPADLVDRNFRAYEPNRLWVADLTYVSTWSGFCYVAFIIDVYSRMIVGWQCSTTLRAELCLDALEQAIWRRGRELTGLVHHSDRGSQYLSIRYTERLADEGAVTSVGSRGDSYDNAMAESVNSRFKLECVWKDGPWRGRSDLELATASWVAWWNDERLHGELGYMPPAEFEQIHYRHQQRPALAVGNQ